MRYSALLLTGILLSGCNPFDDEVRLTARHPSPDGTIEARIIYLQTNDPSDESWVVQVTPKDEPVSGWSDSAMNFPIDCQVGPLIWKSPHELEIAYKKGATELSVSGYRKELHGIGIQLKEVP